MHGSNPQNDDTWLVGCKNGDPETLKNLLNQNRCLIENTVFRYIRQRDSAKDVIQEILIRIARNIAGFNGKSKISTWIYRITVNECLRHLGRTPGREFVGEEVIAELPDPESGALAGLVEQEDRKVLGRCLDKLNPDMKSVMVMFYFGDMGLQEIAEALQVPIGTVNSRIARARTSLKELLLTQDDR